MPKGLFEPCPDSINRFAHPASHHVRVSSDYTVKHPLQFLGGGVQFPAGVLLSGAVIFRCKNRPALSHRTPLPPQGCIQDALVTEHMWIPVALGGMHGTDQAVEPSRRHSTKTKWRSRLLRKHAPLEEAGGGAADMYSFVPGTMLSLTSSSRLQGRTKACSDRMTENGA
jgi:hypothetical protein